MLAKKETASFIVSKYAKKDGMMCVLLESWEQKGVNSEDLRKMDK